MKLGIAECRLSNADCRIDRKSEIGNRKFDRVMWRLFPARGFMESDIPATNPGCFCACIEARKRCCCPHIPPFVVTMPGEFQIVRLTRMPLCGTGHLVRFGVRVDFPPRLCDLASLR
jgi:hypothetical protein